MMEKIYKEKEKELKRSQMLLCDSQENLNRAIL